MKFVLDASVAIKCVWPEQNSDKALALIDAGHELIAPDVFVIEVCHVLSKFFRQKKISEADVRVALGAVLDYRPTVEASAGLIPAAWEIALQSRCSIYDALYIALADREQCAFITADQKLVANVGARYPFLIDLATF